MAQIVKFKDGTEAILYGDGIHDDSDVIFRISCEGIHLPPGDYRTGSLTLQRRSKLLDQDPIILVEDE